MRKRLRPPSPRDLRRATRTDWRTCARSTRRGDSGSSGRRRRRRHSASPVAVSVSGELGLRGPAGRRNATDRREVEINPERNDGRTDHFHDVVRNKDARQQMHADCCDGCAEVRSLLPSSLVRSLMSSSQYYKRAMGPENPIAENHENHFLEDRHKQMEARLQKTSRHRRQHRGAFFLFATNEELSLTLSLLSAEPDPPDYWQMGEISLRPSRFHLKLTTLVARLPSHAEGRRDQPSSRRSARGDAQVPRSRSDVGLRSSPRIGYN